MDMRKSIANQTSFALHLSHHVGSTLAGDRNLAFSPVSLHAIISLIAAGSRGPTLDQILSFLRSAASADLAALSSQVLSLVLADGADAGGPRVSFANGVWVDSSLSLKPSFKEVVASTFKAEAKAVDFQTKHVTRVNQIGEFASPGPGERPSRQRNKPKYLGDYQATHIMHAGEATNPAG